MTAKAAAQAYDNWDNSNDLSILRKSRGKYRAWNWLIIIFMLINRYMLCLNKKFPQTDMTWGKLCRSAWQEPYMIIQFRL